MHGASLGEVAEKYLRRRVQLVGDDVQVAVPVQVEQDRGATGARGHHGQVPGGVKSTPRFDPAGLLARRAEELFAVRSVAVEGEPDLIRDAVGAWLDAEQEFAGKEMPPAFVQEDGVDPVAMRKVHACGDEYVVPAVGVEVVHARSPGPVRLHADRIGDFPKLPAPLVGEQGVPEDEPALARREAIDGCREGIGLAGLRRPVARREDRKSTRLNSSHTVSSYAVFCLKKKKKTMPKNS